MTPRNNERSAVRAQLAAELTHDHAEIDSLLARVLNSLETGDHAARQRAWDEFERVLSAHMDWEEAHVLPQYAREHAKGAARILTDHDRFRHAMTQIGVEIDLRAARAESVWALFDAIREHARAENAALYPWIAARISDEKHAGLLSHWWRASARPGATDAAISTNAE